ncbi:hypothetical protein [Methyloferula stellata]|uniref:hypothetical protein n=1 Tax=Methyloferula stellata TaxID=876270 RepID=UPI00037FFAD8|nr:hypothetical protein [Methyloferula stellata]
MNLLSDIITLVVEVAGRLVPPTTKLTLAGTTVTAGQFEAASGSLAAFFAKLSTAIKAKSYASEAEIAIEEAVVIAADLGLGEPITGIVSTLLPYVFGELNKIGSQPLIPVAGGAGGFVTKQWADDPRHQLNPDGSFKY